MALNFDISKIDPAVKHGRNGDPKAISLVTETIIFATMNTGIGEITEDNAAEFYARASLWESVFGAARGNDKGEILITPQEVRDHIGLTTNVFPRESDTKWRKRVMEYALSERTRKYTRATQAAPDEDRPGLEAFAEAVAATVDTTEQKAG
jgi:hypothetical protein